jgi:tetratricopeptide (TPR) repeat protein
VLFTDVVGSTDVRRSLGDDRADALRRRHDDAIRAAAAEHLGEVVKGTGDGLMLVFPAATQGVAGAVAIQRAVHNLNRALPAPLAVRVGISAGDVAWEGDDCYGTPVVEAARLCDAAEAGQILATEIVRLLVGSRGDHRLEPIGLRSLKGLGEVAVHAVAWDAAADLGLPLPTPLLATETLPLIGRVDEREVLSTAWKRTLDGSPQVALIAGEPGVGKTRLAADAARAVHAEGAAVLFGRSDEELGVAYQPFVEAIAAYAAACDPDALRTQLAGSGELARLVPSLAQRFDLAEPTRADPETERYRLFEAVTALLAAIATSNPTLLVLDDLHWADKATLLLLRHLVRHREEHPLMVVATYRDTDLGRGHPLAEVLADLRREPDLERVVLRGLTESDVLELVETAAGHELDEPTQQLARAIHVETEGNPFFVGQLLRHLVETGGVRVEDGRWVVDRQRLGGIPEGVREVIGKRLSNLQPETNELLAVAAVIGREFDPALLIEASGVDSDGVLDALEEAEGSRLVVPLSGRDDRRSFAHALVRSTLYEEIPTTRRLRIHRRVVDALETRADRGMPCLSELAHHACEAAALGDVDRALRWTRAAADDAVARVAYDEAAALYERVLAVFDPDDPAHRARRGAVLISLSRMLAAAGYGERAHAMALDAAALARAVGSAELLVDAGLVLGGDRSWGEAGAVDREVVEILEEGLAGLGREDSALAARGKARLASELYFLVPEAERRRALSEDAQAMAERIGDPDTLAYVLSCSVWGGWIPGSILERKRRSAAIIELATRSGNLRNLVEGMVWQVVCDSELGDGDAMRQGIARERALAAEIHQPQWEWVAAVHEGAVALMDARFDDAARLSDEALQIGQQLASETVAMFYGVQQFALARARGGLEDMVPLVQMMVDQYPLIPSWRCALAYLYRDLGRREDARREYEHLVVDDFQAIPLDANWQVGMSILAAVCEMLDDVDRAGRLYELLRPVADSMVLGGNPADVLGSGHLPLMLLAVTRGDWDLAAHHRDASLAANDRAGCLTWRIYTELEWGRLLVDRGGPSRAAEARDVLAACRLQAAEVGMTRIVGIVDDLLASLD